MLYENMAKSMANTGRPIGLREFVKLLGEGFSFHGTVAITGASLSGCQVGSTALRVSPISMSANTKTRKTMPRSESLIRIFSVWIPLDASARRARADGD